MTKGFGPWSWGFWWTPSWPVASLAPWSWCHCFCHWSHLQPWKYVGWCGDAHALAELFRVTKVKWTVAWKEWTKMGSRWGMLIFTFTNVVPKSTWARPICCIRGIELHCSSTQHYCSIQARCGHLFLIIPAIIRRTWILVSDPWLLRYCYGRLTFAVKYKNSLKERGAGFLPSMIGEKWMEGLAWHVRRGCPVAIGRCKRCCPAMMKLAKAKMGRCLQRHLCHAPPDAGI